MFSGLIVDDEVLAETIRRKVFCIDVFSPSYMRCVAYLSTLSLFHTVPAIVPVFSLRSA